jgi:hypothetical protein
MKRCELVAAANLLEWASEKAGNAGCNDCNLSHYGFNEEAARDFVREAFIQNDPRHGLAEFLQLQPSQIMTALPDFQVLSFLAYKLRALAKT